MKEMKINLAGCECPLIKGKEFDSYEESCQFCLNCPLDPCIEERQSKKLTRKDYGRLGHAAMIRRHRDKLSEWGRKGGLAYWKNLMAAIASEEALSVSSGRGGKEQKQEAGVVSTEATNCGCLRQSQPGG